MSCSDIADKLNIMSPEEAEPYDEVLCNDLFMAFCANYLTYKKGIIELITTSPEYKIFKRRYTNITVHPFFDAYVAFWKDVRVMLKNAFMSTCMLSRMIHGVLGKLT